jgi:2-polyprenyl-3-methyl-5-hydroxy-6-metoxy-1,4-benzoquinol methylase
MAQVPAGQSIKNPPQSLQILYMKRPCPICINLKKDLLFSQNFHNKVISLMEKYDVVACKKCGFVFADNIPSQAGFSQYYANMSKYEFNYKEGLVPKEYFGHFNKIVKFITPLVKNKKANILDIGCSTGALLSLFKSHGYSNLLGIDPSASCARTVKKIYGIEARANNIANFKSRQKFDLIVLSAVLEHLVDLKKPLEKIWSLLKDDGLLFIEVPDAERFASYIFTPFQQFSIEHINYFSKYSLRNLLSKFYFEVVKTKKDKNEINESLDPDIFILAKKSDKKYQFIADKASEVKIKKYIARCSKLDAKIKKTIQRKLLNRNQVIVWGTGTHTQRLIGAGFDLSKILYFVDSNTKYWGKKIMGKEIKSPRDIKEKNIPIVISTYSYQVEIAKQIKKELKLKNEVIKLYK